MTYIREGDMNRTHSMGRFIDEATDEQRDRLVSAEDFSDNGWQWWDGQCGCLVGTAVRGIPNGGHDLCGNPTSVRWSGLGPALRFPHAIRRFGKSRVVRAVKLRAASTTSVAAESRALEGVR